MGRVDFSHGEAGNVHLGKVSRLETGDVQLPTLLAGLKAVGHLRVCHVAFYCTSSRALEGCNLERKAASCFEYSLYLQHKAAFGKREERRGCSGTLRDAYGWRIKLKRILTAKQRRRVENGRGLGARALGSEVDLARERYVIATADRVGSEAAKAGAPYAGTG